MLNVLRETVKFEPSAVSAHCPLEHVAVAVALKAGPLGQFLTLCCAEKMCSC